MTIRMAGLALLFINAAVSAQQIVPCEIVVPILDANHKVVTAAAPDGHLYPVFQTAPPSKLVADVRRELETSFAQQVLRLDRYARNLIIAKRREEHIADNEEWLTSPMYLLMSTEEGGFARFGFWLQDTSSKRRLALSGYVDQVVGDDCSQGCILCNGQTEEENLSPPVGFEKVEAGVVFHLAISRLTEDWSWIVANVPCNNETYATRTKDLTDGQWAMLDSLIPEPERRKDRRGRPWKSRRSVLNGVLWVLRTGAPWADLPERYPSFQTCHRRFQQWVRSGVMKGVLEALALHLTARGALDVKEAFIDGSFAPAKKGGSWSGKPNAAKGRKSWPWQIATVCLWQYTSIVLRHMR